MYSPIQKQALNLTETAQFLGVSYVTACKYAKEGRFPSRRVGSRWLIPVKGLRAFIGEDVESDAKTLSQTSKKGARK